MNVSIQNPAHLSQAMFRVSKALTRYAPKDVQIVSEADADLVVLHVIGYPETLEKVQSLINAGKKYALIMYCMRSTQKPNTTDWLEMWAQSSLVWSYYDLQAMVMADSDSDVCPNFPFYHSPLGVDEAFNNTDLRGLKFYNSMSSGYVNSPAAEAIEEMATASWRLGRRHVHLGPWPQGMSQPSPSPSPDWTAVHGVTDDILAGIYRNTAWVSGLRHAEGFELPAAEGLCCGARPIVFDRPEMRRWYSEFAEFVPESSGEELVQHLLRVMENDNPVDEEEQRVARNFFAWEPLIREFWERVR